MNSYLHHQNFKVMLMHGQENEKEGSKEGSWKVTSYLLTIGTRDKNWNEIKQESNKVGWI